MIRFSLKVLIFLVVLVVFLELGFRSLVPAATAPREFQYSTPNVMALEKNQEGSYTVGRLARDRFQWRVNNAGFNSLHEYKTAKERDGKCIAVIGSSYVQGFYSDVNSHFSACLEDQLNSQTVVYNLGTSGMPLSQAINVVAFARENYQPDLFIIEVSNGSLRQSIRNHGFVPFSKQFRFSDSSIEETTASVYEREDLKNLLRKSAVIRYLIYNANINLTGGFARPAATKKVQPTENYYEQAVSTILTRLQKTAGPVPILLFSDADRKSIYLDPAAAKPLAEVRILAEYCEVQKIPFLDLTDKMKDIYSREGKKFNFSNNYHWNPYGVDIVSGAVYDYMKDLGWVHSNGELFSSGQEPNYQQ